MKHKVKRIHFVGVGGVGMSGIAEVLRNLAFTVSGSDLCATPTTQRLIDAGIRVHIGHRVGQLEQADVVVVSTAVAADNPELQEARACGIPIVPRAMMLAELMRLRQGIAVAGTHGKTTTTSLIASILAKANLDPTYVIGGRLNAVGHHAKLGSGDFIVVEADESDASFLYLNPVLAVVTNIDADHMDAYGQDFERLKTAFVDFLQHLPFYGRAVLCIDDPHVREIIGRLTKPWTTYGVSADAHVRAEQIRSDAGRMHFEVHWKNGVHNQMQITLNMPGHHNVLNALAAIAIGLEVGVRPLDIQAALAEFGGVGRRFQRHGEMELPEGGCATLVDDYGHHPVEMAATLAAARAAFPGRRLVLAFQPHRYTRTRDLFDDFVQVLCTVDVLLLAEVYAAGEMSMATADGRTLARALRLGEKLDSAFIANIKDLPDAILRVARPGDLIITMGAGSIGTVPAQLLQMMEEKV